MYVFPGALCGCHSYVSPLLAVPALKMYRPNRHMRLAQRQLKRLPTCMFPFGPAVLCWALAWQCRQPTFCAADLLCYFRSWTYSDEPWVKWRGFERPLVPTTISVLWCYDKNCSDVFIWSKMHCNWQISTHQYSVSREVCQTFDIKYKSRPDLPCKTVKHYVILLFSVHRVFSA